MAYGVTPRAGARRDNKDGFSLMAKSRRTARLFGPQVTSAERHARRRRAGDHPFAPDRRRVYRSSRRIHAILRVFYSRACRRVSGSLQSGARLALQSAISPGRYLPKLFCCQRSRSPPRYRSRCGRSTPFARGCPSACTAQPTSRLDARGCCGVGRSSLS